MTDLVMSEGIGATWLYHLREMGGLDALCGADIFDKALPASLWGFTGHLGERYCNECKLLGADN